MFGIALCVNLYKQAMAFEKGHHVQDPDKQAFLQQIEEIQENVEEIKKETCSANKLNDV